VLLAGGILAPSTGRGIEKFPSLRNSPYFGRGRANRLHADRFPALVVFPQSHADDTPGWQKRGGEAALLAVDVTIAEFNGDSSRVYLTGYSAGGNGSWYLAAHHPQRPSRYQL
jgi:predicted peptidase